MPYDLQIKNEGLYIHAKIEGVDCLENFKKVWNKIAKECNLQAATRILCEGCLEGSGMTMDLHQYGKKISETDIQAGTRIAIVCSPEDYEQFHFGERTSTTSMPVFPRIFRRREKAVEWLTKG